MLVRHVMTMGAETIGPGESLRAAAEKMRAHGVGALPVCEGDRVIGMLTDRDSAVRAVALGLDPSTTAVRETMTPQALWCFEDQDTAEAARIMEQKAVRRLMVVDHAERLVGLLSVDDLAVEAQPRLAGEVLDRASALRPPAD